MTVISGAGCATIQEAAAKVGREARAAMGPERCAEADALIAPYLLPGWLALQDKKAARDEKERTTDLRRLP